MNNLQLATEYLEKKISGRYITNEHIAPLLKSLSNKFKIETIGKSVLDKDIFSVKFGIGKTKVLIWSQMHGNESTTTKGLFDFFNYLSSNHENAELIYKNYTLYSIPILNPDGAEAYTRVNANKVDLNRDAFENTQPESVLLRTIFENFKPDFCYNLHDQRTIFGTEGFNLPATVSFLAPAYNETRDFNDVRYKAIQVINKMNENLQKFIPNQVGRFDDSFNINCIGDYFTYRNIPTVLFEAGHYKDDYQRDEVRKYIFCSLLSSFNLSHESLVVNRELDNYLQIPQNSKCFYDFLYKNVRFIDNSEEKTINFAAQYVETLQSNTIHFEAQVIQINDLENHNGHLEFDFKDTIFNTNEVKIPEIGDKLPVF
ncbi:M14 family metallopeptidase [Flavobacterium sediminilitoris]|uniref:M14 family metallopeptidase n=1 Tax=Flavobacterium sediminilitoris TaxID=2024526 RepID=A0ABY4HL31_9FLAO|nr:MULTISPECIES: M14 metallopeptidase family protein [Flavobacterium]UOX33278.1 M14 family metallopeptidase [Flavobacterium sediminilitoris]